MKQYQGLLIFAGVFLTVAAAVFIPLHQYWFALGALIAGIILFVVLFLWLRVINGEQQAKMDRVFRENDSAGKWPIKS